MELKENLNQNTKTLLIANEKSTISSVHNLLTERYEVRHAESLANAAKELENQNFDIILLDLELSDTQGIETLDRLLRFSRGLPILLLLKEADYEIGLAAIRHGAEDYIFKNNLLSAELLKRVIRYSIERNKSHRKIKQSEVALKLAQDIAKMGPWTWYPDKDLFVPTKMFFKIFEIDGLKKQNSMIGFLRNVVPEDRKKIAESIRKYQKNRKPIDLEFRILTKNQTIKYIHLRGELIDDASGEPMYYGSGQDITNLRLSRENLNQRERFLEMTGESASLGGWEIDLISHTVFWTKAMYDIHEVTMDFIPTRETAISYYSDDDQQEIREMVEESILKNSSFTYEKKIKFPNGSEKWIYCMGRPVYVDGIAVKMTGIMQDVTESHTRIDAMRIRAAMLDNVGEAALAVDKEWKIIFWNKAAEKLYKYKKEEVLGRTTEELQLANVPKATIREVLSLLKQRQSYSGEFIMKDREGRTFPVYASNSSIFSDEGEVVALLNISRDISQDRANLKRLEESEDRFRKLFEYSPLGKALTDLNTGKWLDSNKTFLQLLGYTKREFKTLTVQDITPPEYRAVDKKEIKKVTKSGKFGPYQKEYFKKDGTRFKALITGFIMENEDGPRAWTHILDLTELEEKTEALNQSEERFREYIEYASDVFLTTGKGGEFTSISANIHAMLGYHPSEIVGESIFSFIHPDEVDGLKKFIETGIANKKKSMRGTYRFKHKDGYYKYIQGQGSIRQKENGEYYSLLIARDMDYERKTELHVREQNAKLKDIAFIQSHIVRRPLSNILGLLQINQMNRDIPEGALRIINLIRKEAEVMDEIIAEIVDKSTALTNLPDYDE